MKTNVQPVQKKLGEKHMKQKESRIWNGIERFGNKLPHPVYIFMILTVVVFIVSALCGDIVFPHPNTGE